MSSWGESQPSSLGGSQPSSLQDDIPTLAIQVSSVHPNRSQTAESLSSLTTMSMLAESEQAPDVTSMFNLSPGVQPLVEEQVTPRTERFRREFATFKNINAHVVQHTWEQASRDGGLSHLTGRNRRSSSNSRSNANGLGSPSSSSRRIGFDLKSGSQGNRPRSFSLGSISSRMVQFGAILAEMLNDKKSLHKKNTDVQLAAQIGEMLLEKNTRYEQEISALNSRLKDLKEEKEAMEDSSSRFQKHCEELSAQNMELLHLDRMASADIDEIEEEILEESVSDFLRHQLSNHGKVSTGDVEADLATFRKLLRRDRVETKIKTRALEESVSMLDDELDVAKTRIKQMSSELNDLRKLKANHEELRAAYADLEEFNQELRVEHLREISRINRDHVAELEGIDNDQQDALYELQVKIEESELLRRKLEADLQDERKKTAALRRELSASREFETESSESEIDSNAADEMTLSENFRTPEQSSVKQHRLQRTPSLLEEMQNEVDDDASPVMDEGKRTTPTKRHHSRRQFQVSQNSRSSNDRVSRKQPPMENRINEGLVTMDMQLRRELSQELTIMAEPTRDLVCICVYVYVYMCVCVCVL